MNRINGTGAADAFGAAACDTTLTTAVGASYAFDPRADGVAGIYAARVLERGADPRALCAEVRAEHAGASDRGAARRAMMSRVRVAHFGRGTASHLHALQGQSGSASVGNPPTVATARRGPATSGRRSWQWDSRWSRRLAAAGLALALLLPLGAIVAGAQESSSQARYIVQSGDTLDDVAAEFGVDPAAILAASALQNPPQLTAEEIIVIPSPGESPEAAAATAAEFEGTSPFVAGAYFVAPGDTLARIASAYGIDPWALAAFNGIGDVDALSEGQRLRIPMIEDASTSEPAMTGWALDGQAVTAAVGGANAIEAAPAPAPVFAADVPAYQQMYSLSCEYAAAYIATAGLGWGVPESAFQERIGQSANPHWGYRGDIYGAWGGADDYGVYPEALVPTLNEFGYVGDVFYGGDPSALTARLDAGMPVLAWLGYFGDTGWVQQDEGSYLLAPGMHVVTVYGYDDGGVYVSNPGRGNYDYYTWGDFLAMWQVLDGMALGIAPM
jgi:uncharacterized protein YvpB